MTSPRNLWVDDVRPMPEGYTIHAFTFQAAKKLIMTEEWELISFDHDLGADRIEENGLTLMNILEERIFLDKVKIPLVLVHTANGAVRVTMQKIADKLNLMEGTDGDHVR